jgi:hypothetical protein
MTSPMKSFSRILVVFALILCTCCAQESSVTTPEIGLISSEKYTNAFFDFSLPLPQDATFSGFQLPSKGDAHSLYGMQAHGKNGLGLTAFIIVANQLAGASSDQAREAAAGFKAKDVKKFSFPGRNSGRGNPNRTVPAAKCVRSSTRLQLTATF